MRKTSRSDTTEPLNLLSDVLLRNIIHMTGSTLQIAEEVYLRIIECLCHLLREFFYLSKHRCVQRTCCGWQSDDTDDTVAKVAASSPTS